MKSRLLKSLRRSGRNQINILSVTTSGGTVTGFSHSYSDKAYREVWSFGDTEEQVFKKAENIYIKANIERLRIKYKKPSKCRN